MPFSTYKELKESIINWSHRKDIDLLVPDFIALAEIDFYNPPKQQGQTIQPLKIKQLETTSTLTVSTSTPFLNLPTNYGSLRDSRIDIVDEADSLEYRTPEQLRRFDNDTGRPCFFTIIGNQIEFDRTPDEAFDIEIVYYGKATALSDSNTSNEVLVNYPNLYLYGALRHLYIYASDPENQAIKEKEFITALKGANKAIKEGAFGPSPVMKVRSSTP